MKKAARDDPLPGKLACTMAEKDGLKNSKIVYLAHEEDCVEDDEEHDKVLEGRRGDQPPDVEPDAGLALGHIHLLRLGLDHVGDARLLQNIEERLIIMFLARAIN